MRIISIYDELVNKIESLRKENLTEIRRLRKLLQDGLLKQKNSYEPKSYSIQGIFRSFYAKDKARKP